VLAPVLGIETSCDETAAALLAADGTILAQALATQPDHIPHGGVVPEIAARAHLRHLPPMLRRLLAETGLRPADLGGVAASVGPGLIGGLLVGAGLARGLALAARLPFVAVNHLEAHALTARLPSLGLNAAFPYLLLLVSGGHTLLALVEEVGRIRTLGTTRDDAVGEAFDKVAKLLGLGWPGGPALERLAREGDPTAVPLPRPMLGRPGCELSLSGLKTAVALRVAAHGPGALPRPVAADLAASFQAAIAAILADRVAEASRAAPEARLLVAAGGVAANATIRQALAAAAATAGLRLALPPPALCTDNAVMVAWAGIERLQRGLADPLDAPVRPRYPFAIPAAA
jgi:N6-L-threonylcarbamoyladenine synthase